jgi:exosortase/archaeosortase family protein
LSDIDVGVVEACNGLRMTMTFFALSVAVAVYVERPFWQKALIALSAIPIALGCNIVRIAGTCILHETVGHELADRVFHDLAGWLMIPAALIILRFGLIALDRTFVPLPDPGKSEPERLKSVNAIPARVVTSGDKPTNALHALQTTVH